jgi:hypothetical protein
MANAWLAKVKSTMAEMRRRGTYKKGDGLRKVIEEAKKTYTPSSKSTGKKSHRTRRHRKSRKSFF